MKEYVIGNSVTSIGENAFRDNTNLTTVSVGENTSSIGEKAFYGCSNMTTFTCCTMDIPTANASIFEGIELPYATLYVPASSIEDYEETKPWKRFGTILPIDEGGITTPINKTTMNGVEKQRIKVYDMNGCMTTSNQRGLLIMKDRNGKTRKVVVK